MEIGHTEVSDWLLKHYAERKRKNPAYSVRSFARGLKVSAATLSQLMSGKRPLGQDTARRLADAFMLSPQERDWLFASTVKGNPSRKKVSEEEKEHNFFSIEEEEFQLISNWQHFAILALANVEDNRAESSWISKRLGISKMEAKEAFQRLIRLNVIELVEGGFRRTHRKMTTTHDVPSAAIRKYHFSNLDLAKKSLETHSVENRDFTSVTLAFNREDMKEAKKMIKSFRRRFWNRMEGKNCEEAYMLAIQFFPLNRNNEKKG